MQTNEQKFAVFMEEALPYIDMYTPTIINEGGCGQFAKLLSEKLTEFNVSHTIYAVFLKDTKGIKEVKDGRKNLINFLKNKDEESLKNTGEDHIVVRVGDLYLDSKGIVNITICYQSRELIEISYENLCLLDEKGKWNETFDKDCIPFIKEKLDYVFSQYDNFHQGMFDFSDVDKVKLTDHTIKEKHRMPSFSDFINSLQ